MSLSNPVLIPLLNPNEPEALLAALHIQEGQHVAAGDLLCTLETTKSAADVQAEQEGYVTGLRFAQGQTVRAGETLCLLADEMGAPQVDTPRVEKLPGPDAAMPEGLRITRPALELARQLGVDLDHLPKGQLVTESTLRAWQEKAAAGPEYAAPSSAFDPGAIIVYGGGGHGKALIDLLRVLGTWRVIGVVDDGIPPGTTVLGATVLGGSDVLAKLHQEGVRLAVNAVGGIGNVQVRIKVFHKLAEAGFACPAVVHPTAFVEASANLSPGVQVFAHAYVGSEAKVGFGSIVNTGAIVSHDCILGEYVNISPGAMLAGEVHIGAATLVGMGATVNLRAKIGSGARIGNGATVKEDVPSKGIVRAGAIWP